jgi:hypothetical protein
MNAHKHVVVLYIIIIFVTTLSGCSLPSTRTTTIVDVHSKDEHDETQNALMGNQQVTTPQSAYIVQDKQPKDIIDHALSLLEKGIGPSVNVNDLPNGDEIEKLFATAFDLYDKELMDSFILGTEDNNLEYLNRLREESFAAVSLQFLLGANLDPAARNVGTFMLLTKGRVLDAMTNSMAGLRQIIPKNHAALLDKLRQVRSQMAKKAVTGITNSDPDFVKLHNEAKAIEEMLIAISADFRMQTTPVTLKMLKDQLPEDTALLDIERIPGAGHIGGTSPKWMRIKDKDWYYAIVLTRHMEIPEVFGLGKADLIDLAANNFRSLIKNYNSDDVLASAKELGEIFSHATAKMGNIDKIIISPDSNLNLIPFGALIDKDGRFFVEKYHISYINSPARYS